MEVRVDKNLAGTLTDSNPMASEEWRGEPAPYTPETARLVVNYAVRPTQTYVRPREAIEDGSEPRTNTRRSASY